MQAKFNPIRMREVYLSENASMLKWFIATTYDPKRPMGNVAAWDINDVVACWLAGLYYEVAPVIPRSIEWLAIAISQDEGFDYPAPNIHREKLHSTKALALWLQSGDAAIEVWERARQLCLLVIADGAYGKKAKTDGMDDYLCYCIQAEQYTAGIAKFEKYHGAKKISLKKTLTPREFGYAVCLNQITPQFDPEDLLTAGRKMLQANLEDHPWLGYGDYKRAAQWLKIVYWHNYRSLTPLEVILKAYENMPNVVRPDFV